jgi:sucrose-6-phosphate hydrolase SacC (GH32 family)
LQNGILHLRIILDRSSVEIFGGRHGEVVLSALIFPEESDTAIELYVEGSDACIEKLEIFELKQTIFD